MAFVSGGGGGLPPQGPQATAGASIPGLNTQQLLETLLLHQQQQQQQQQVQQQQQAANSQGNVVALLTQALLGGGGGALGAGLGATTSISQPPPQQPQQQQPSQNVLLQQLQNQIALTQLLGGNNQLQNPLLSGLNPNLALYYQLLQQQQQTNLLQQLQASQQSSQPSSVQQTPAPAPVPTQPLQISSQAHSAFQPPQPAPSNSGSVEVQLNAQEKLMALLNAENQQNSLAQKEMEQRLLAASTSASTSAVPDRTVPRNTKEVHDRIDKLISDNAAILQPQEPLLKRRPYHRAVGQQSSMDDSNSSSTRTSPGIAGVRDPRMLSSRTQSLYEPINGVRAFGGGSLTSGQPVIRHSQHHSPICPYCQVPFPNEAGLQCHELRCSKRIEMEKAKEVVPEPAPAPQENNRHPLKRRLLAAVADEQPSPQQAKLARKDSGDVVVVAETKPSPQPERKETVFEQFGHPGLPRRATIAALPTAVAQQSPPVPSPFQSPIQPTITPYQQLSTPQMISPPVQQPHPTAFHQVINPQRVLNAAQVLQAVQQQQQLQQAPSTSSVPSQQPQVIQVRTVSEEQPAPLDVNRFFPLDGNVNKPYTLVLNDAVKSSPERTNRTRNRNITSETFVCLQRAQPMFVEQKGNLSMYSNWHQMNVNEADAKLNLAFMAQCSAKPRTGHHPFWKYTVANRDMVQYKVTHSSFWEISQKLRMRQVQDEGTEPPMVINVKLEEKENIHSPILINEASSSTTYPITDLKPIIIDEGGIKLENGPKSEDISDDFDWKPSRSPRINKKTDPIMGGHRTDELYVYVRGRGRGRYVCDRCGIRCKKPSMLKKHIKSHTDIRPYKCKQCNFCFKTKGNLTKHLSSKTHKRRIQQGDGYESDNEDRLEIAEIEEVEEEEKDEMMEEVPDRLDEDEESDEEMEAMKLPDDWEERPFRRFGQEDILLERGVHTPPSRWVLEKEDEHLSSWPESTIERRCMSAPPVVVTGSQIEQKKTVTTPLTPPLPITAMQFVQVDASPTAMVTPIANGITFPAPKLNGQSGMSNYSTFFPKEETLKCDQCDKTFRKQADLNYHQLTHNVEKQQLSNKNRMFQCPECRLPARTKAMLSKHMEQAHGSHIDESAMAAIDPSASTQSVLGGGATQMVNNPRSFMCLDCNIGFRKHGILAKHLRSKTHVTKLETLKRLPEDSLSLIQGHDNGACLNEVDTTDCEKARVSLTAIVENIRSKKNESGSAASTPATSSSTISLECREQLAASPMPINHRLIQDSPSNGLLRSSYSETSSPFRSRCGSAASTTDLPRKRSDSLMNRLDPQTLQAMKFISANVWVPPKAQDQSNHRSETSRVLEAMEIDNQSSCNSPVMRILAANGNKTPPIPPGTKCTVCGTGFDTPVELQIHLYTDHISVKDGTFFRCPKKLCEKVYPNKESLRAHVTAHYRAEFLEIREEDSISSGGACPSIRGPEELEPNTPMTDGSDSTCHSPTAAAAAEAKLAAAAAIPTAPSATPTAGDSALSIPCIQCGKIFHDYATLQQHWMTHIPNRAHVCQICDAGFTSQDQLLSHQATHLNHSANGVN